MSSKIRYGLNAKENYWLFALPLFLLGLRSAINKDGISPVQLTYGCNLDLPVDFFISEKPKVDSPSAPFLEKEDAIRYFNTCTNTFSHLHPSPIEQLGEKWAKLEQLYPYAKATIGIDPATAAKIKKDGKRQKRLSHEIRNAHPNWWNIVKQPVMVRFYFAKFSQNPHLLEILLATGDQPLIENNAGDPYWGSARNEAGKVLMLLRDHIRQSPTRSS